MLNLPSDLPLTDGVFTPRVLFGGKLPAPLSYDPAEANRLLDAAGWHDRNGDGVRQRDGRPFRFTAIVTTRPDLDAPRLAVLAQAHLRRVGVQMEIQILDNNIVAKRTRNGQFEAAFGFLFGFGTDTQKLFFGRGNPTGYANPEAFRLLDAAVASTNPNTLDSIYQELTETYRADLPFTRLVPVTRVVFAHRRLRGLQRLQGRPDRYMEDLWLEDER